MLYPIELLGPAQHAANTGFAWRRHVNGLIAVCHASDMTYVPAIGGTTNTSSVSRKNILSY